MVTNFVVSGARLERPGKVTREEYALISRCWAPVPDERPCLARAH